MKTIKLQFTDFETQINKSINQDWCEVRGTGFCDVEHMSVMTSISHAFWTMTKQYARRGSWLSYNDLVSFWNGEMSITIGDITFVKKGKNKLGL